MQGSEWSSIGHWWSMTVFLPVKEFGFLWCISPRIEMSCLLCQSLSLRPILIYCYFGEPPKSSLCGYVTMMSPTYSISLLVHFTSSISFPFSLSLSHFLTHTHTHTKYSHMFNQKWILVEGKQGIDSESFPMVHQPMAKANKQQA